MQMEKDKKTMEATLASEVTALKQAIQSLLLSSPAPQVSKQKDPPLSR